MHEVEKLCCAGRDHPPGPVQAEGTPDELLEEFDQPDLEELFFALVECAERRRDGLASWPSPPGAIASRRHARIADLGHET